MIIPAFISRPEILALVRLSVVCDRMGCSRSTLYRQIAGGLAPRPIKLGNASVWPAHEIQQLIAARIAGLTESQIGALVATIHASRAIFGRVSVNDGLPEASDE